MNHPDHHTTELKTALELALHEEGNAQGLNSLFKRHSPVVRRLVRRRVLPSELEDVVQDVMVRAVERISTFDYRGEGSFLSWLAAIAASQIKDRHRRAIAQRRDASRTVMTEMHTIPSSDGTPSQLAIAREGRESRERALAALDPRTRSIMEYREFLGLEFKDIARQVGLNSTDAARMAYQRGKAKLENRRA